MKKRIILLFLLLAVAVCSCTKAVPENVLQLFFLDVGQGDCILLRTSDGDVLIDSGTDDEQEYLLARLHDLGVKELELAVFTHADGDHVGGGDGVIKEIPVKEVWMNETGTEEAAVRLHDTIAEAGLEPTTVTANDRFQLGRLILTVLSPFDPNVGGNEGSIVLHVSYGNFTAILTGDAETKTEAEILRTYPAEMLSCDLLKVAHHGSSTSSSEEFLNVLSPTVAVISCARYNGYGHPHGEVLARLEKIGTAVLRTDLMGEIIVETDGETIQYQ